MALTSEDTKTMKGFLDELRQQISADTERQINTAIVNIERKTVGPRIFEDTAQTRRVRKEIQATEDNLKKEMKSLKQEFHQELKQNASILQIHMNVEFKKMNTKLDQIILVTEESKKSIIKIVEVLENQETRIQSLEERIHACSNS